MKIKFGIFPIVLFLTVFISLTSCKQQKTEWQGRIEDVDGVTVVRNPKEPLSSERILTLEEDLVIGHEIDKENHWFSFLNALDVDGSGNIYTLDPKDIKIRVFDSKGTLLRVFGREGQGPGELRGPGWLKVMSDGKLVVFDVLNRRFTYFTQEGRFLKAFSVSQLPRGPVRIDSKGFIYQHIMGRGPNTSDKLLKYEPDLTPIMTICSFENTRKLRVVNPFPAMCLFEVTQEDNLVWFLTSGYEINIVGPDGKTIRRIIKEHAPRKVTESDKIQYLDRIKELDSAPLKIEYEFPEYYPAASGLFIDDQNRIYVKTYERADSDGIYYDIFGPEGQYIARFSLPKREGYSNVVKSDKFYCVIRESEEGIPLVKRYAIKWK